MFAEGTHVKANANLKKGVKKQSPVAAKRQQERMDAEIEADRSEHGKPLKKNHGDDDTPSEPEKQKPLTAPTADAGCKMAWICKQIFDSGRIPSLSSKRPMTKDGNLPWYEYVYDEYYDCVLCPQNKVLSCSAANREGCREYKSKSCICRSRPVRE